MLEIDNVMFFGNEIGIYKFINVSSYFIVLPFLMILNLIKHKELDDETNAVWVLIKVTGLLSAFFFPANIMNVQFAKWFTYGLANYFGNLYTAPLVLFVATLVFLSEPLKRVDYYAPAFSLTLMIYKLACFAEGCCYGKEWANGMFNYTRQRYEIPVQLVEAGLALLLTIFLMWYLYSGKAKRGTVGPAYIFGFSFTRFFAEFLRGDFLPRYGPLDVYHVQCIVGMVIGAVLFILMRKYGQRIDDFFARVFKPWRAVILSKVGILRRIKKNRTEETIQEG